MVSAAPSARPQVQPPPVTRSSAVACKVCGEVHAAVRLGPGEVAQCVRCGSTLHRRTRDSLSRTAAFTVAAILLYVPANMFPILHMELYGTDSETTVWGGVKLFYRDQQVLMAGVVLMASIVIPILKLLGLLFLCITTAVDWRGGQMMRTWMYRGIEAIGRWAMLDVFALAIWVATVKLQRLATVYPGPGLLPFGCVVLLTLAASISFDPQTIWDKDEGTAS